MPFTDRFQLLDLKRDEGARTYEAREIATGRPVYVHVFADTSAPLNRALLAKLDNLPEEERRRIIDRGDLDVGVYVVTDRLAEYPGLREWLKAKNQDRLKPLEARGAWQFNQPAQVVPPVPPAPPPLPAAAPKANEPGEFTRQFITPRPVPPVPAPPVSKLSNSNEPTVEMRAPVAPPAVPPPVPASNPVPRPAGERRANLFDTAPLPMVEPSIASPPAVAALGNSGVQTLQMGAPVEPPAAPPPVPAVAANEPGEFTRQFAPPVLRPKEEPRANPFDTAPLPTVEPSIASPPPVTALGNSGVQTLQMSAPAAPPPAIPAPAAVAKEPGEFTRQFAPSMLRPVEEQRPNPFDTAPLPTVEPSIAGEQTVQMEALVEPPPAVLPPAPAPVASEPGEFTRQFVPPVLRPSPTPAPKDVPAPSANEPGEFTRQFARPILRPTATPSAPASPEPGEFTRQFVSPSAKPAVSPKPAAAPGEFTRQFQAPQRPTPPQSPKLPPQPAPQTSQSPGEFTQLLQAQRPAGPPPVAKQPSQTGEFSRYFESPMMPPAQSGPGLGLPLAPARPPSHPKDAGEFTQIFGRGDIPTPPPAQAPAAPPNPVNANATQVFATPRPNPPMAAPNFPQNSGPPSLHHGPGEYTQMFAKPASLTLGQAPPSQPASRAVESGRSKRNKSRLPLLLVIGAVVLLIIAAIVYFVMRQRST